MKKRLAMLCYRVARWLAPSYFAMANSSTSVNSLMRRVRYLRNEYEELSRKQRDGEVGAFLINRILDAETRLKAMEREAGHGRYEQLKIEIQVLQEMTVYERTLVAQGMTVAQAMNDMNKRALFMAVAKGLADSAEIDKFIYFKKIGDLKTIGIRLYLRHDDNMRNVGNYDK